MSETTQTTINANVTPKAVEALKSALQDRPLDSVGLKVSVMPGGCSGFSYGLAFEEEAGDDEIEISVSGVRLFVPQTAAPLLDGITIDYVDTLMGGGFKIENPNASSTCGCGKSFS